MTGIEEYSQQAKRVRKRKPHAEEGASAEAVLSPRDKFRVEVFHEIMDKLITELDSHNATYADIAERFSVFRLLVSDEAVNDSLRAAAERLLVAYEADIDDDLLQFRSFLQMAAGSKVLEQQPKPLQTIF